MADAIACFLEWGAGAMERRAPYASLEEARAQALHDLGLGLEVYRIADVAGQTLVAGNEILPEMPF